MRVDGAGSFVGADGRAMLGGHATDFAWTQGYLDGDAVAVGRGVLGGGGVRGAAVKDAHRRSVSPGKRLRRGTTGTICRGKAFGSDCPARGADVGAVRMNAHPTVMRPALGGRTRRRLLAGDVDLELGARSRR